ncbi:unnamed protein product [Sphenostylis stenocarpa]|uniref:WIYLD domain-containing protein n=1 Tax=Sphenostylis stenocarpa TaxID=92480 RepID=A0AA86T9M7_9FABA|nr:unnamed protein product [Sphenostylis stenocarpa]
MALGKKVGAACRAMGILGIDESKVKSVLKKLLRVFDKNWELIEAENYRVLVDAIFEDDDNVEDETECEEAQMHIERDRPLKRLRLRGQGSQSLHPLTYSATSPPSKRPKLEDNASHEASSGKKPQDKPESSDGNPRIEAGLLRPEYDIVDKGKQPASTQVLQRGRKLTSERAYPSTPPTERIVEAGRFLLPNNEVPRTHTLIIPKDEPIDEVPDYEMPMPIAVILPEPSSVRDSSLKNCVTGKHVSHVDVTSSECRDEVRDEDITPTSNIISSKRRDGVRDEDVIPNKNEEATCNVEIASSNLGELKFSLICSLALQGSHFRMPSRDQLIEMMEDKCLRSYKIADPNFCVRKLLRDICDCMPFFTLTTLVGKMMDLIE